MFEIGWTEILLIAVVAIVVIGPKDLPRVMRIVGQWTGKMKRMGREFQNQFQEALREAELEDVRKDIADICGTTLHSASRILTPWEKAGWLTTRDQHLTLHEIAKIRHVAEAAGD